MLQMQRALYILIMIKKYNNRRTDDMIDSTIIGAIGPAVAALTAINPIAGGITGAAAVFALIFWRIARTIRDRREKN